MPLSLHCQLKGTHMKNKKKLQPWMLFLAGTAIMVNIASGLATPGAPASLLRSTLLPAGILTISPRLETDSMMYTIQNDCLLPVNQKKEILPSIPTSTR
jgi:hypothetical protein